MLGIGYAAFDTCNLRTDQRGAVFEVLRAMLRPYFELPVVIRQSLEMLLSLVGRCRIPGCGVRECAIEARLCCLEL